MTQTFTIREGRANVFAAVEHANSEVVGIHASRPANRFEALEPVRQGVRRCIVAIRPGGVLAASRSWLKLYVRRFQDEIECLGIEASPSFVREPEGNGVAERFIRTLKVNLLWVRTFDTIAELRAALVEFATRYNATWLVARHSYRTPAQVRADQCRLDPNTTPDLTRLRGFALENGNSTIFWTAKYLICKERRRPFWPKTAVVKTYPIPKRG
jgi:putative transposase